MDDSQLWQVQVARLSDHAERNEFTLGADRFQSREADFVRPFRTREDGNASLDHARMKRDSLGAAWSTPSGYGPAGDVGRDRLVRADR